MGFISLSSTVQAADPDISIADLILEAQPIRFNPIQTGASADAIDGTLEGANDFQWIVTFRILNIMKGKLPKVSVKAPSRLEQTQGDSSKKKVLRWITQDFDQEDSEFEKQLFRVAVVDPEKTFGLLPSHLNKPNVKYRLYANRYKNEKDTYIMIAQERLSQDNPTDG